MHRTMAPPPSSSTSKKMALNPFAPNFTPLRNAPPPSFPSTTAAIQPFPPPPPPVYLFPYFFTYTALQQTLHTYYSTYHVAEQTPVAPNPPPLSPPSLPLVGQTRTTVTGCGRNLDLVRDKRRKDNRIITRRFSTNETRNSIKERNRHQVVPLKRDEENTTIMIKNIPYDCSRNDLINMLDYFCLLENDKAKNEGTGAEEFVTYAYDFIYLPIDFRSKKGRGFAFVNFTNVRAVWRFLDEFHQTSWYFVQGQKWSKKIEIACAKFQGKEALVNHFRGSVFECETDEFLPAIFSPPRDGSGQPVEVTVIGNRYAPPLRPPARYNYRPKLGSC
ncbi:hypothetical protein ACS0TY_001673 [Phlomoides rotata]